jgi:hypothetical protein
VSRIDVVAELYREWRVTGRYRGSDGVDQHFDFIWSPRVNPGLGDSEALARDVYEWAKTRDAWIDVRLHVRDVVVRDWRTVAQC